MRAPLLTVLALAVLALAARRAGRSRRRPGSTWTQATITEPDGTKLHADVLRPSEPAGRRQDAGDPLDRPVLQPLRPDGPGRPGRGHALRPDRARRARPSRFYDFVNGAHLMERGYTYVMVDLRGFGGVVGLPRLGRPGRAGRRQGRRRVGGRAAVVDRQGRHVRQVLRRRDRADRRRPAARRASPRSSRRSRSTTSTATCTRTASASRTRSLTPALYDGDRRHARARPATTPGYNVNALDDTARPGCHAANYLDQQSDDHGSAYWKARDLIAKAHGLDGRRSS